MSHTKRALAARDNSQFICRLSMERCRSTIAHMRAVLHVCEEGTGEDVAEALHQMIHVLDLELAHSLKKMG